MELLLWEYSHNCWDEILCNHSLKTRKLTFLLLQSFCESNATVHNIKYIQVSFFCSSLKINIIVINKIYTGTSILHLLLYESFLHTFRNLFCLLIMTWTCYL